MSSNEKKMSIKGLSMIKRKPIGGLPEDLVQERFFDSQKKLPAVIQPTIEGLDIIDWVTENQGFVRGHLSQYGGILFRGFNIASSEDFKRFMRTVSVEPMEYHEGASPRTQISNNVYTSTDYPADHPIFLHNELSYRHTFPTKIFFWCQTPAEERGETPIADVRQVYEHVSPATRERFARTGWMLVRNFGDGFGLSWQQAFHTTDKAEVERYCEQADIQCEWKDGNRLRTRQVRPAIAKHPQTGEMVWFNHIAFFHVSSLTPAIREAFLAEFAEEDLPTNTYYGDGSPIEEEVLRELFAAYDQETVAFRWEKGDLLMLDNILVAHGRSTFTGPRRILVGMSDSCSWSSVL